MGKLMDELYSVEAQPQSASDEDQRGMAAFVVWYESEETKKFLAMVDAEIQETIQPTGDIATIVAVAEQNAFKKMKAKLHGRYQYALSAVKEFSDG